MTKIDPTDKKKVKDNEFEVNVGDELYVNVRSRIIRFGKDASGLEVVQIAMDELLINGILPEDKPITFWAPVMLVKENVLEVKKDREKRDKDNKHRPLELSNPVDLPKGFPDASSVD